MIFTRPEAEYLQHILAKLGLNPGKVDGIVGERTKTSLGRFQAAAKIPITHKADEKTAEALAPYFRGFFEYETDETLEKISERFSVRLPLLAAANPERQKKTVVPVFSGVVPTDVSYSHKILSLNLESLAVRFPFLSVFSIGKSVLGKDIYCLKVGRGKKEIFYNGAHHANEWITSPVLMRFAEELCTAAVLGTDIAGENARKILESSTIYIVPTVNPDGVDIVTGAYPENSKVYRDAKTMCDGDVFPDGWKANAVGVDLNLNYPAGWEDARDYKFSLGITDPAPFGYVGKHPLSEPETKAVAAFTEKHDFALIIACHSQGKEIFPEYNGKSCEKTAAVAEKFAEVSGYTPRPTPAEMGNAGYKDWFIDKYGRLGFTLELGLGRNPLPISQFGEIYRDVVGIFAAAPLLA